MHTSTHHLSRTPSLLLSMLTAAAFCGGCGSGEYNARFQKTLQQAATPPAAAENPAGEAEQPAAAGAATAEQPLPPG